MAAGRKTGGRKAGTPNKRKLSPKAQRQADAYDLRTKDKPAIIKFKIADHGGLDIDHTDDASALVIMEALGLSYGGELAQYIGDIAKMKQNADGLDIRGINQMIAQIVAIGPRDSVEAMLAAQMVAVHEMTLLVAGRMRSTSSVMQSDSASNSLNKLGRTFAAQVEALTRYRSKGQQKVVVEHLHAHAGSQVAIIGQQGGGGAQQTETQPHGRTDISERSPMLSHSETLETPLPLPSGDGLERMPVARSEGRGADGDA